MIVAKFASQLGVSITLLPFIPERLCLKMLHIWANWRKEHPACKDNEAKIIQLLVVFHISLQA